MFLCYCVLDPLCVTGPFKFYINPIPVAECWFSSLLLKCIKTLQKLQVLPLHSNSGCNFMENGLLCQLQKAGNRNCLNVAWFRILHLTNWDPWSWGTALKWFASHWSDPTSYIIVMGTGTRFCAAAELLSAKAGGTTRGGTFPFNDQSMTIQTFWMFYQPKHIWPVKDIVKKLR